MLQKLQRLGGKPGRRILYTGIGNVLRSDDGAGVYICRQLESSTFCEVLVVEVSIENYIGRINRSGADVLVLVDCVDFGRDPGYFDLLPVEELKDLTFHTHNISLRRLSELFRMPAWILGIQPANTSFGEELSLPVMTASRNIIRMINSVCGNSP
jgi:hydrogenase maturation protease